MAMVNWKWQPCPFSFHCVGVDRSKGLVLISQLGWRRFPLDLSFCIHTQFSFDFSSPPPPLIIGYEGQISLAPLPGMRVGRSPCTFTTAASHCLNSNVFVRTHTDTSLLTILSRQVFLPK